MNDVVEMDYFAVSLPDLLIWEDDLTSPQQNSLPVSAGAGLSWEK
jgi:hypothetical protein